MRMDKVESGIQDSVSTETRGDLGTLRTGKSFVLVRKYYDLTKIPPAISCFGN